ncbi:hypothetical protein LIA77_05736 [Sarocladium implicatum]|jgi:hypothetical protein|nr:hypothetical protein LIA77_05736 [Sarocladium implicatum]
MIAGVAHEAGTADHARLSHEQGGVSGDGGGSAGRGCSSPGVGCGIERCVAVRLPIPLLQEPTGRNMLSCLPAPFPTWCSYLGSSLSLLRWGGEAREPRPPMRGEDLIDGLDQQSRLKPFPGWVCKSVVIVCLISALPPFGDGDVDSNVSSGCNTP